MWLLFRYADVQRLTTERARWSSAYFDDMPVGIYTAGDPTHERYAHVMHRNLMMNDAPDHTRLRKLLNHAFAGRATKAWDETISTIVDEVLESVPVGTPFDLFQEIGEAIPLDVIASLLGVPMSDRRLFRRLSVSFATNLSPGQAGEERDRTVRESVELSSTQPSSGDCCPQRSSSIAAITSSTRTRCPVGSPKLAATIPRRLTSQSSPRHASPPARTRRR